MSVEQKRVVIIPDIPEPGGRLVLPDSHPLESETSVTVTCDSPTCKKSISWVEEEVAKSPEALPDDAARLLIIVHYDGRRSVYCGWDCLRRSMKDYVPPLSPREKAAIEMNNAKVEAAKQNPDTSKIYLVPAPGESVSQTMAVTAADSNQGGILVEAPSDAESSGIQTNSEPDFTLSRMPAGELI